MALRKYASGGPASDDSNLIPNCRLGMGVGIRLHFDSLDFLATIASASFSDWSSCPNLASCPQHNSCVMGSWSWRLANKCQHPAAAENRGSDLSDPKQTTWPQLNHRGHRPSFLLCRSFAPPRNAPRPTNSIGATSANRASTLRSPEKKETTFAGKRTGVEKVGARKPKN